MPILASMFETLFNSYCSVCLSEGFFVALTASQNCKSEKASFFQIEQLPKKSSIACAEQQSFVILHSCNFACKHKKIPEILSF